MNFKLFDRICVALAPFTGLRVVLIASLTVTSALLGVRQIGGLEPLELAAYDQMMRWRPDAGVDSRLLVVTIAEPDIRAHKWPLSDRVVAQMLASLQQHEPAAIGLNLYRDFPQERGYKELMAQLSNKNIIVVTNDAGQVLPPKGIPAERIGFNDLVTDPFAVVRRNLLFIPTENGAIRSFSLLLAQAYLAKRGIVPQGSQTKPSYLQLGKAIFVPLQPDSGGYQTLDARGYQILLDYRSPHPVAKQVTLTQVLNGEIESNWIEGKIVLIGSTAPSLNNGFNTPYSTFQEENYKMSGVLVHAQMVSQFLSAAEGQRPLFQFWPEWAEMLWIFSWSIISGGLAWRIRHPLVSGLSGIAIIGVLVGLVFCLFIDRKWIPAPSAALGILLTGSAIVTYRSDAANRQQKMVMKLLGQNTSPEIAAALWRDRDRLLKSGKLPGQTLTATLLFSDIKDFSTVAEQIKPEALLEWLNEYLSSVTQEVQAHRGIINKFTGDGIMAVFGVPMARTTEEAIAQDARSAVACALAMGDRLQELNRNWQQRGLPVVQMRVGIFTGPVVAGSLGGKERLEYGIIGDSVNIASRLESYSKDRQPSICRILIAKETLDYLQGQFEVESWGSAELKGRHQTVDVYRVVSRISQSELDAWETKPLWEKG